MITKRPLSFGITALATMVAALIVLIYRRQDQPPHPPLDGEIDCEKSDLIYNDSDNTLNHMLTVTQKCGKEALHIHWYNADDEQIFLREQLDEYQGTITLPQGGYIKIDCAVPLEIHHKEEKCEYSWFSYKA